MSTVTQFNEGKFTNLCAYIKERMTIVNDQHLFNVMAHIDLAAAQRTGSSITGTVWIRVPDGFWPSHVEYNEDIT